MKRKATHFQTLILYSRVICFLLFVSLSVQAQTTVPPTVMAQINTELQKRGLTQNEVRSRLLQKGIDLENMPPSEIPKYQSQVIAILDELQAEKNNGIKENQGTTVVIPPANVTPNTSAIIEPITTPQEAAAEASQRVIQSDAKKGGGAAIYGHAMFTDHSLDVFRTTDGAQAPDTYVLSDGDEVRISIFGASQTDIQQKIAVDGSIQPTGVAKIFLKGLTLAQAREVIRDRLSSAYTFRADQFAVTIVTARTIMVTVFGEAKITGGFNLSALNSALNALAAAGGPTSIGSIRSMQLIRGNTRKNIDLYAFMNDPAIQFKFDLQNNDILFVPVIKTLVSVEGAVNRPMAYEMLPDESLSELIRYAGGVKMDVFPDFVQIQRFTNGEERLIEWNLEEVMAGNVSVPLLNGDIVRIKSISKPMDQYVEITGSVYYPGRFDLSANKTLRTLLDNSRPTYQAKTDLLFVERVRPDETVELLSVPFPDTQAGSVEFMMQPRDKVKIMDQATYRDVATIAVSGHVRIPFERMFSLSDHITVKQAIDLAGGLKISAYPIAYISRKNLFNPVEKQYIRIELEKDGEKQLQPGDQLITFDNTTYAYLGEISVQGSVKKPFSMTFAASDRLNVKQAFEIAGGLTNTAYPIAYIYRRNLFNPNEIEYIRIDIENAENIELQPGDQLNIFDNRTFSNIGEVRIFGAVKTPGGFTFDQSLTIRDLITNAGGFTVGAAFNRVEVFRTLLSPTERTRLEMVSLEVDSSYQVVSPFDFKLQPYDQVVVRLTPEFSIGRVVEITGQVKYPGAYVLESKQMHLTDVIKMAGGLLRDADPYGVKLFRTYNNRGNVSINLSKAMNHPNNNSHNPILFEGDVININRLENTVAIRETGTRMGQYSANPELSNIKNIVFQGSKPADWYIKNFAGGFEKDADKNSVTVTLPNNQMRSTKKFLFFRSYPVVESGSFITMQIKPQEAIVKKEKKPVDWNAIWSTTMAATTTMISIFLLIDRVTPANP